MAPAAVELSQRGLGKVESPTGVDQALGGPDRRLAAPPWNGPSAYTSMARTQDGLVCALIECGKKDTHEQIAFVKFAAEWLKARKAP